MSDKASIEKKVDAYYTEKIRKHGAVPSGVDWNSLDSQWLRFQQFEPLWKQGSDFSLVDFGCGYGAMYEYFQKRKLQVKYRGYDISKSMLDAGRRKFTNDKNCSFFEGVQQIPISDFTVASGIFNVKLDEEELEWEQYIKTTIKQLASLSAHGVGFNFLTDYSDEDKKRPDLYYASPEDMFSWCIENFGRKVQLIHDYPLYEFTILVRL